jgi:hypothetical protein
MRTSIDRAGTDHDTRAASIAVARLRRRTTIAGMQAGRRAMAKSTAKSAGKRKIKSAARKKSSARRRNGGGAAKTGAPAKPKQAFVASHYDEADFKGGLRAYAKYRDLGIAAATQGLARAHVIRMIGPCNPGEVSKLHLHDVDLQLIYVLKGWMRSEFEGEGAITMREGSCWLQPPKIKHKVLDYSDGCEVLEIILPADFATVELEQSQ